MWTPRSVRWPPRPRLAPLTGTPNNSAITRWWACAPTPGRYSTRACAGGPPRAARLISFPRRSPAPGAPAPPGDSVCAPTRGSSATTSSTVWIASRCPGRSPSRCMPTSKPPSAPFPRRTGRPLPIPSAAKRTSLRPQLSPDGAATSARSASSCAAPASPTRPRASCGRTGATTRSSPTEPTSTPSPPTSITANTPPSNWPSAISRTAPAWRTCPRGASPPTPPG